jgi:hypothetical protein
VEAQVRVATPSSLHADLGSAQKAQKPAAAQMCSNDGMPDMHHNAIPDAIRRLPSAALATVKSGQLA